MLVDFFPMEDIFFARFSIFISVRILVSTTNSRLCLIFFNRKLRVNRIPPHSFTQSTSDTLPTSTVNFRHSTYLHTALHSQLQTLYLPPQSTSDTLPTSTQLYTVNFRYSTYLHTALHSQLQILYLPPQSTSDTLPTSIQSTSDILPTSTVNFRYSTYLHSQLQILYLPP